MAKIVMINTVCSGSHGRIMADLRCAAEQVGHTVTIAAGRGAIDRDGCVRVGSRTDVYAHVALTRLFDRHARGSLGATRALVRTLRDQKPDLVHLHNVHGYYLHAETLFAYLREANVQTLWTLHDCWAFTGHCSHFARARCDRWKTGCHHCPLKREYPASALFDASRQNWRWKRDAFAGLLNLTIATPSQWLSDIVAESFLRHAPRVVIPNGVDLSIFRPNYAEDVRARVGVMPGQRMLLAVAAPFDARKGYADALRIAETLGDAARLVMVGLSEHQLRSLPNIITGIARTETPEALIDLYGAADCLINPTYEDTYPTVNMEAIACGTPVAAYDVGGCAQQLAAPCGATVRCGDAVALANMAMRLAERAESLRAECRAHAERAFDRMHAMDRYLEQYRRMLGA